MKKLLLFLYVLLGFYSVKAQEPCLLEKEAKQDLVQDYANIIPDNEEAALRNKLIEFNKSTSTQILIVTVTSLCGHDKAEFTYTLGEKLGVGQKGKDNGIVVMVKPKEIDGKGEAFIATGYGLEGVLPDAIAKRIIELEMIPYFKKKDYTGGIISAANTIMSITSGEFSAENYKKKSSSGILFPILIGIGIVIFAFFSTAWQTKNYAKRNNISFWVAWGLMSTTTRNHGGSWGNFHSGGGGFGGGGGGGFGGFGGGGFGGGGAGGSW